MHSKSIWKLSKRPNYNTNTDRQYPYSEIPYVGDYDLIKIPASEGLIDLVDYWGEGRIVTEFGSSGFDGSWCVNHEYQLVSNGPDRSSKIPNRIPVISYVNCDTSGYIKDNTVKMVTLMGAPINESCAGDIARMVNRDEGKVVVYGFDEASADVMNLEVELGKKGLVFCFGFELEALYKEPTLFDSYRAYLNIQDISEELYQSVTKGANVKAVKITKSLDNGNDRSIISDTFDKLLKERNQNTMAYSNRLWLESEDIVKKHLPVSMKLIYHGDNVKIINKKKSKPLILETNTQWQFKPSVVNNRVYFSIRNVAMDMFLGLDAETDADGQRNAFGYKSATGSNDFKWLLHPVSKDGDLFFNIMHREFRVALKLGEDSDSPLAHSSSDGTLPEAFGWIISPAE